MFKRRRYHYYHLLGAMVLAVVFASMIPLVNVNNDMTKYLPDSSKMKQGIDIIANEFDVSASMMSADVRVMFEDIDAADIDEYSARLCELDEVDGAQSKVSDDGRHVLYELSVPKSVDQKKLGKTISAMFDEKVVVETSQDGATPPLSVVLIAAAMILLVLVFMSVSWMEPILFLGTAGVAIVMNVGSNALMPSVSITTNYIVAILQLVLSLDYSVILMNRYRQERDAGNERLDAMNRAIKRAAPSILSSALTTVVGLVMLVFMKLKIGADMGIVLAKGVFFSLICTFTVMPSLVIMFHGAIERWTKSTFVIPTDALARFCTRHKLTLAIVAISLFCVTFFFRGRTEISFSTNGVSAIGKIFPQKNMSVIVYDTDEEMAMLDFSDSIKTVEGVAGVLSYPTVLKRQYTSDRLLGAVHGVASSVGYAIPQSDVMEQITPEMLHMLYFMKHGDATGLKITFPDLADFIIEYCLDNPLISDRIDDGMRQKLELYSMVAKAGAPEESAGPAETPVAEPVKSESAAQASAPAQSAKPAKAETASVPVVPAIQPHNTGNISVITFMPLLNAEYGTVETLALRDIVDTVTIQKKMTVQEMSGFIKSTASQTRLVYSFSKSSSKTMTPLEYVHFLSDDLFNRKSLASMVTDNQKHELNMRKAVMDYAMADAHLSAAEMTELLHEFGVADITEAKVKAIAFPETKPVQTTPAQQTPTVVDTVVKVEETDTSAVAAADSTAVVADSVQAAPAEPVRPRKTLAQQREELFEYMMYSGKAYTSSQMAKNFARLGEKVEPELIDLLYTFYASSKSYDESWTMSIEDVMEFVGDEIMTKEEYSSLVDDDIKAQFDEADSMLIAGVGSMRKEKHSLALVISEFPAESAETYQFIDTMWERLDAAFDSDCYVVGESAMFSEMKKGFNREMMLITLLTVLAIFVIIAVTFRSIIVPTILVMAVMTAVWANVIVSGLITGHTLYIAYLISQSILMGATIDYGILFASYYKESRKTLTQYEAAAQAYRGSIKTIMTSGLIMVAAPGVMAIMVDDVAISAIVGSISVGAFVAVFLILTVVPGVLVAFDKLVVHGKVRK